MGCNHAIMQEWQDGFLSISDLDGVALQNVQNGQVLVRQNGAWRNGYPHAYSTSEQVVGTWIDGKPIYQKTITLQSRKDVKNDYTTVFTTIANIENLIRSEFYDTNSNSETNFKLVVNLVTIASNNGNVLVYYPTNGEIKIKGGTLWYTKTTD